jgi:hypothetical protein
VDPVRTLVLAAALAGCGDPVEAAGKAFDAYVLPAGFQLVYTPLGDPYGQEISLRLVDRAWELRDGAEWEDGALLASFPADQSAGVEVDGTLLLPASLQVGATTDGITVEAIGETETWYGTFPDAVEVTVASDGAWDGPAAFAAEVGPVRWSLDGTTWDLVTYDPTAEPTTP